MASAEVSRARIEREDRDVVDQQLAQMHVAAAVSAGSAASAANAVQ